MGSRQDHPGTHRYRRERLARQALRLQLAALGGALVTLGTAQTNAPIAFDSAKAWSHLLKQVEFGPRPPGSDAANRCREYLREQLAASADEVRLQTFEHRWSITGQKLKMANVVGEMNWENARVRVVLLAHWDTRPTAEMDADPSRQNEPILGANDGASGVAVLLELARVLKGRLPKDLGVQFLLTDGEDLGPSLDEMFLGAQHYAKHLPTKRPDYGILLDMIGDKDLRIPIERNSYAAARTLVESLYGHAHQLGLQTTFPAVLGATISDDHLPLIRAGIPTVDLIDFSYAPWHTHQDTADKCSADSLGKVGRLLESFLLQPKPFSPNGN